jgi:hypothetical protein
MPALTKAPPDDFALIPMAQSAVSAVAIHQVITAGDLSVLSEEDRALYYLESCRDLGLNWRTTPFILAKMKTGGMQLYLTASGAEQLARNYRITVAITSRREERGAYLVEVTAILPDGRSFTKTGGKAIANAAGEAWVDLVKKAETQAFRRAVKAAASLATFDPDAKIVPIPQHELREAMPTIERVTVENAEADPDTGELEIEEAEWAPIEAFDPEAPARQDELNALVRDAKQTFGFHHRNEFLSWVHQVGMNPEALTRGNVQNLQGLVDSEKRGTPLTPPPEDISAG